MRRRDPEGTMVGGATSSGDGSSVSCADPGEYVSKSCTIRQGSEVSPYERVAAVARARQVSC